MTVKCVEVLERRARGLPIKAIAEELGVSDHAVDARIQFISKQIGVRDAGPMTRYALEHGLAGFSEEFLKLNPKLRYLA